MRSQVAGNGSLSNRRLRHFLIASNTGATEEARRSKSISAVAASLCRGDRWPPRLPESKRQRREGIKPGVKRQRTPGRYEFQAKAPEGRRRERRFRVGHAFVFPPPPSGVCVFREQ